MMVLQRFLLVEKIITQVNEEDSVEVSLCGRKRKEYS